MTKKARRPTEPEESLCCCEFVSHEGERTHMAACFCDCEHLDEACDRWFKGEAQKESTLSQVAAVVRDRLRVPWPRGARRVDLSVIPPLVLLPVFLHLAALHLLLGVLVMIGLPVLVLWYYYATHRRKSQTLFFLSLALFSLGYMYYLFLTEVVPRGDVGLLQLCTVTMGVVLTLFFLTLTKRDPGYLRPRPADTKNTVTNHGDPPELACSPRNGVNPAEQLCMMQSGRAKSQWCSTCRILQPPRAGHCRICGFCVRRLDHHCVWINSCVGRANHRCFLLTLLLFLLTSVQGISLVLHSVCPKQNVLFSLFYCPGVYTQYSRALCFTCSWYCSIVTGGLLYLLIVQLFNVSYNVTEREVRLALRHNQGRRHWGLIIDTGTYSHGFLSNWTEFLTMNSSTDTPSFRLHDLV
ncbi:palmitoyltransferase ZDHHC23-B [Conger conger]|uniref:palmitoyltransferase ZDHHC23-B n=1 Tax=Conger conger TaxID=82655 RepID=UPI002A59B1D8|nr:palmitoyltransferase ZDHHC23-B [Conger conger]XP_061104986.1 palmitoyltransferase ZDHHC23-B [Conger conger]